MQLNHIKIKNKTKSHYTVHFRRAEKSTRFNELPKVDRH